jgi:hypothetical protein
MGGREREREADERLEVGTTKLRSTAPPTRFKRMALAPPDRPLRFPDPATGGKALRLVIFLLVKKTVKVDALKPDIGTRRKKQVHKRANESD